MDVVNNICDAGMAHDVINHLPGFIFKEYESYFADVPRGEEVLSILEFAECLYPNALREAMKEAGL